jgi:Cytochrome P450.
VGSAVYLKKLCREKRYLHLALDHLAQQYDSPVIGLKLGHERTVVVLTHELVQKVHTREEYEGRPYNFFIKLRSMGARRGKRMGKSLLVRSKIQWLVKRRRSTVK